MGENSAIEWTDHTFNPWWGCEKVSPACDHCYAETWSIRCGMPNLWAGERRFFGDNHWHDPVKWNSKAAQEGVRRRVFCASMADVFDNHPGVSDARERLWGLIHETQHLDWLLLTKRIGNARHMLPLGFSAATYPNVWVGISVVNQQEADRDIPKLLDTPAAIRFLSCEPLLGPIEIRGVMALDWVIVGGESGHKARPMLEEWARRIRGDCALAGTYFFMKQGSQANWPRFKDFDSFDPMLQVRQWPRSRAA